MCLAWSHTTGYFFITPKKNIIKHLTKCINNNLNGQSKMYKMCLVKTCHAITNTWHQSRHFLLVLFCFVFNTCEIILAHVTIVPRLTHEARAQPLASSVSYNIRLFAINVHCKKKFFYLYTVLSASLSTPVLNLYSPSRLSKLFL